MKLLDLSKQQAIISKGIYKRIDSVLSHGKYIDGPEVFELEEKLAEYVGRKYAISTANGTDALQIALMALGIGSGDHVITTSMSFFATSEAISSVGAVPIFVDVDAKTFNICPQSLMKTLSSSEKLQSIKAILAVNLFGLPADYVVLKSIAERYNLKLIEDAAQSFGASISEVKSCKFGDISTTSFFPAKPLGCYGDGGALFTDNKKLANVARSIKNHGKAENKYENIRVGMNSRLDTIQAAILLEKLNIFDSELDKRSCLAQMYSEELNSKYIKCPEVPSDYRSAWAQYTIQISDRDCIINKLNENDIPYAIYYPIPLHRQPVYKSSYSELTLIASEALSKSVLSLPMHPYLTFSDIEKVISVINSIFE